MPGTLRPAPSSCRKPAKELVEWRIAALREKASNWDNVDCPGPPGSLSESSFEGMTAEEIYPYIEDNENEKTLDFMPNCEAYYTEYKKNHPEKLAMIHISANGRLRTRLCQ